MGQAGAYEGQGRVFAPAWALCCRSSGCGGGVPGRAQYSTRFLRQPVTPEENLPPVSKATLGAPPVGRGEDRAGEQQGPGGGQGVCCRAPGAPLPPLPQEGVPGPQRLGLTDVDAALGVDRHVRAWGLAADQFLTVHLDGASPALSGVGGTGSGLSPPVPHAP